MEHIEENVLALHSLGCCIFSTGHQRDGLVLMKRKRVHSNVGLQDSGMTQGPSNGFVKCVLKNGLHMRKDG